MTGIMLCDYLIIRRRRLVIPDLYIGDSSSIYWYHKGFHWRTILAFLLGFVPLTPGFIMNLIGNQPTSGWVKLFQITFLVGLSIGFVSFWVICTISPPPFYREGEDFLVRLVPYTAFLLSFFSFVIGSSEQWLINRMMRNTRRASLGQKIRIISRLAVWILNGSVRLMRMKIRQRIGMSPLMRCRY
jgi:hypothetical protein